MVLPERAHDRQIIEKIKKPGTQDAENSSKHKGKGKIDLKLVQFRNPWGETEWSGDWSDKSACWTDTLKQELGWTDDDDGVNMLARER